MSGLGSDLNLLYRSDPNPLSIFRGMCGLFEIPFHNVVERRYA